MKKFNKTIAIQGDAIQKINIKTDTTILLALEAQSRGYKIYYYETKFVFMHHGMCQHVKVTVNT